MNLTSYLHSLQTLQEGKEMIQKQKKKFLKAVYVVFFCFFLGSLTVYIHVDDLYLTVCSENVLFQSNEQLSKP